MAVWWPMTDPYPPRSRILRDYDVRCQECGSLFKRPKHLEAWVPATHCLLCRPHRLTQLEQAVLLSEEALDLRDAHNMAVSRKLKEVTVRHPALEDVKEVSVRKWGEAEWSGAE